MKHDFKYLMLDIYNIMRLISNIMLELDMEGIVWKN
jgi:hypothetical protein